MDAPEGKIASSDSRELALLLELMQAIEEAEDFDGALRAALEKICVHAGWDFAECWLPRPEEEVLQLGPVWFARRESESLGRFRAVSEGLSLEKGVGLPGEAWQTKKLVWLTDFARAPRERYPRAEAARKAGLRATVAVPVFAREELLAVLVFSMFQVVEEEDRRTADLLGISARLLGAAFERKRAHDALLRSEALLEAIVDNSPAVIFLKDTEGRYLLVNRQYERLFHVARERIKGATDYDLFPREAAERFRANDLQVIRSGEPREFEEQVPQEDGLHVYIAEKFPLRDAAGAVYAVCGIATDITARKEREMTLEARYEETEEWLRGLIEATQDAVISIDREGRIVLFNPAAERIFGYRRAEVQGKKVSLLMPEPYASEHDDYIRRYEQTGERRAIGRIRTVAGKRKNGEIFPLELSVTEVAVAGEVRYAALIRDISDKVALQRRLIENERLAAVGLTASKLAHEIANPLNGMYMTAQLLERLLGLGESHPATPALKRLSAEIRRLDNLLQEFGELARRERYVFYPLEIPALIRDVLEQERPLYEERGIEVVTRFSDDLPKIRGDREKLTQALLNLCKNAREAMPQGGRVTLRAYRAGAEAVLEVEDTGKGVPPGIDIFEPFVTTKKGGTGLGLLIVRQIATAHGGRISYSSEEGKGAVFRLHLPVEPKEPERPVA